MTESSARFQRCSLLTTQAEKKEKRLAVNVFPMADSEDEDNRIVVIDII